MTDKDQKKLIARQPVVVIMGHIDHGKSTLLDYIRKTKIVESEAGGITQHIGAYEATHTSADGASHRFTFVDTPGHEAFCNIRERGAKAADIAILAVSGEDGVKPQTLEAFKTIKKSGIPFIVAITKIDKPSADVDRTKQSLGEHEIYVEGWGGDVPVVGVSGITGKGIPELLELVSLVADLAHLTSNPAAPAMGIVIESTLDSRKGISATLLVRDGTLMTGSFVVAKDAFAPVRFIEDFAGKNVASAGPSMPVRILGWSSVPECGSEFSTVPDKKTAEAMALESKQADALKKPVQQVAQPKKAADAKTAPEKEEPTVISVPLIIKADAIGSLDGVKHELEKIRHDRVRLKIVSEGVGDINEKDVKTVEGDPTIEIIGFNVGTDKKAANMIERSAIPLKVKAFSIIYELVDHVRELLTSKIPKEYVEEVTGRARILALFSKEKDRQVIGGKVEKGEIQSGNDVRIMRREAEIGRGKIRELQSKKLRVKEVAEGHEFGMLVEAKMEIAPGDRIEAVRTVEKM